MDDSSNSSLKTETRISLYTMLYSIMQFKVFTIELVLTEMNLNLHRMNLMGWLMVESFMEVINQHYKEVNGLDVWWSNVLG